MKHLIPLTFAASALLFTACGDKGSTTDDSAASNAPEAAASAPAAAPVAAAAGSVPLTTEIPPELIEGTPQPIKVANLEKAPSSAPVLMVPEGTKLLSAGKPVTGSDDFPIIGELEWLTDGDKEAGEGYFFEIMDGPQWVQIDLEASADLAAIWVWHYHSQARAYHDVVVQVSNDAEFASGVTTLFNNDYDNSAELGQGSDKPYVDSRYGKLIDAKGTNARYVRLYSNGNTANDMNHYIEVEVYGK
ncbi:MAG: galactose-binding domain-containing protein [Opitutaceae bacterium]